MLRESPALQIVQLPIADLHPDPANPRLISDAELESLTRSLREFGFVQPVLARRGADDDHVVVGGHQRLLAARRLGYLTVPAILLDISKEQAQVLNLALNRISGSWDDALLARLLANLQTVPDVDLALSGFGPDEIGNLLKTLDAREKRDRPEAFDLDAALEQAQREPRTKPGDLWLLGDHRILCGDATDAAHVGRLLGPHRPAVGFTDPPYNVAYGDHGGQQRGAKKRRIQNDALAPEAWEAFCHAWATNLVGSVDGAIYVCMSSREWPTVSRVLAEAGAHWSDTLIWSKDRFTLGRSDYQRQYEPLWYGWREGAQHFWLGDRNQGDVWTIPRPSASEAHPTMKPIELVERAITNSSQVGDRVLDLFLGSGSTLIAAERTGRVCCGLELDPWYCDVVVARWEQFTGRTATREGAP
jgi:DNA modification methylase